MRQAVRPGPGESAETEFFTEARGIADGHFEAETGNLDLSSTLCCSLGEVLVERQTKGEYRDETCE
jgi:hypothetical protein